MSSCIPVIILLSLNATSVLYFTLCVPGIPVWWAFDRAYYSIVLSPVANNEGTGDRNQHSFVCSLVGWFNLCQRNRLKNRRLFVASV